MREGPTSCPSNDDDSARVPWYEVSDETGGTRLEVDPLTGTRIRFDLTPKTLSTILHKQHTSPHIFTRCLQEGTRFDRIDSNKVHKEKLE